MRLLLLFIFCSISSIAQDIKPLDSILSLEEYLGFVKKFHPFVKQAQLEVSQAQAGVLAARGGFDPKIEIDYDTKRFKNSEYFSILNSTFKIPTWYGVEIKAGFDQTDGIFLNPQNTNPINGLATLGVAVPIGQGLLINKRMADLQKAKLYNQLSQAERDLEVASILHQASITYFNWYRNYVEYELYKTYLKNATIRLNGVKGLIRGGDKPAIDSVEAGILVKNRKLNQEQSRIKFIKSGLELSNFLWIENNVPLEIQDGIIPENDLEKNIENTLKTNGLLLADMDLKNHPKIRALQNKVGILEVDKKFKGDLLKPRIDLNYNYLSEPVNLQDFNVANYKYGVSFSFPLFLRKERGNFRIAKFKLEQATLDLGFENVALKNKIDYQLQEIESIREQMQLSSELVVDFQQMLTGEERLFFLGESSIFLINSRENSLLSSSIQEIDAKVRFLTSNADLFKLLANPVE